MKPVAIFKPNCGQIDTLVTQGLVSVNLLTVFAGVLTKRARQQRIIEQELQLRKNTKMSLTRKSIFIQKGIKIAAQYYFRQQFMQFNPLYKNA